MKKIVMIAAIAAMLGSACVGQDKHSTVKSSPGFELLKSFAGTWKGTTDEAPGVEGTSIFRVVSDGSAVMLEQEPDKPRENMVTVFYPDGTQLLMTHYCASHNQPHMKLMSATANKLTFETVNVTNLSKPSDGHMTRLVITQVEPDHQVQEWTYSDNGKEMTGKFDLRRVAEAK
jgi:hypothetical protein